MFHFWHPEDPAHWTSRLPCPDPGSVLSSHVVAIVTHTRTIFFTRISYYTHTHTHCTLATTLFRCGWVRDPTWHHKGWDEVNRITYTNYHRHCAPVFKNIYLLISFEVTPQKLSSFNCASNWVKFLIEIRQYDKPVYDWDASCAPFWMQIDTFIEVAFVPSD